MKQLSESTIIVCSIVRNAEKGLKRNMLVMDRFLSKFADYYVIVYENDSIDKTKELLRKWSTKDPDKIHVSLNDTDPAKTIPSAKSVAGVNPFFSHKRIDKMARLRNNYMQYVDEQGWEADYLMVVDLDVAQLYLDGLLSSFKSDIEWDAVSAFGYSTSPKMKRRYHDTYALTLWEDRDNPQTEKKIKELADRFGSLRKTDEWVRIASGFGGIAIYKFDAVKGLRYTEPALDNDDKRVEVKCEHFSLYKQMIERGYDKIYINPDMQLKYQDLTWSIVYASLGRMIDNIKGWITEKLYMAVALPLYAIWDKLGLKDNDRMEDENEIYVDYVKNYGWLKPNTKVSLEDIITYADWKKARKLADSNKIEELYALLDSWVKERQLNLNFPFIRDNNIKVTSSLPNEIILPWLKKWEIG